MSCLRLVELLSHIVEYLPTAQSVAHLSSSCHRLNDYVEREGWRTFAQTRFPSFQTPPHWRDASHALTTLSRNWDRRAFVARYIEPSGSVTRLPEGSLVPQWRRPKGQTMGFQPVIDSYEEYTGSEWSDREEVVAWSAGAEFVMRVKTMGRAASHRRADFGDFDHHGYRVGWITYRPFSSAQGRDDITFVNILRPSQRRPPKRKEDGHSVVVGTASGDLTLLNLQNSLSLVSNSEETTYRDESPRTNHSLDVSSSNLRKDAGDPVTSYFVTNGRKVQSADVSSSKSPLLAACLSERTVALYSIDSQASKIAPLSEITTIPKERQKCRIWSTHFLSDTHLAVGLGPSVEPVHVYEVTPSGLSKTPVRKFGLDANDGAVGARLDMLGTVKPSSSVYPIAPLPASSQAGYGSGQLFLTGGYDGIIRLHDLRSPSAHSATYQDPTDDSAVYSLQALGRERLVAGTARHNIMKVFDLRLASGRAYHYVDVGATSAYTLPDHLSVPRADEEGPPLYGSSTQRRGGDWNVFVSPRNQRPEQNSSWRTRRARESPIYALSAPSCTSPSLFAGVENNVVQFDFVSVLDRHPDPIFEQGLRLVSTNAHHTTTNGNGNGVESINGKGSGLETRLDVRKSWDPAHDALNFAMYEQSREGAMRLRVQRGVGWVKGELGGYDERWMDASRS
ncbi:hypothetical protein B0A49_09360 [Cryomyces minteri]|uniref:F-box domain-containing protein n=1 Tax=Cryomyces minteri TaxID=331657 RepID=A0A4U0WUK3_9PEZI|nr:hypothetical protein B0A49_09360 [Cryomyces minteri]